MKKIVIGLFLAVIIAAGGGYWSLTRQFEQHLEDFAAQVAMFGQLDWQGVHLHPGGEMRVNNLHFQPHALDNDIRIGRIAFRAPNLYALITSANEFEAGRLPRSLGMSIQQLNIPLDDIHLSDFDAEFSSGLPFEAAGCGVRQAFSTRDLAHMDYWNLVIDLDVSYQVDGNGESMHLRASTFTREISGISAQGRFHLGSDSLDIDLLMRAWTMARLQELEVTYRNLGFRERMIDLCTDETGMRRSEYLDHHHQRWMAAWAMAGLDPDQDIARAYREFLQQPDELRLTATPEDGLPISAFTRLPREELLSRLDLAVSVNHAPSTRIGFGFVEPVEEQPLPETADDEENDRQAEPVSRWKDISPDAVSHRHVNSRIVATLSTTDTVRGHLVEVDADNLHIRVRATGGYLVRPFPIDRIESLRVRQ